MQTQQLSINTQDRSHDLERSEEAAIVGEMARRLLDIRETSSAHRATSLIAKLHALCLINPEAFWMVVSLLTGDLSEITRSYEELGAERGRSKQGQQQAIERVLFALNRHFPELAKAVIELRHITAEYIPQQNIA